MGSIPRPFHLKLGTRHSPAEFEQMAFAVHFRNALVVWEAVHSAPVRRSGPKTSDRMGLAGAAKFRAPHPSTASRFPLFVR